MWKRTYPMNPQRGIPEYTRAFFGSRTCSAFSAWSALAYLRWLHNTLFFMSCQIQKRVFTRLSRPSFLAYFSQIKIFAFWQNTTYPQDKGLFRAETHYSSDPCLFDGAGDFALMKSAQAATAAGSDFEVGWSELAQCLRVFVINFFFVVSAIHARFRFRWSDCPSVRIIFVHNY